MPNFDELFKEFSEWYRTKWADSPDESQIELFYLFLIEKGVVKNDG